MNKKSALILGTIFVAVIIGCSVLGVGIFTNSRVRAMVNNLEADTNALANNSQTETASSSLSPLNPVPTAVPDDLIAQADAEELLLINLYERVNPSVVNILVVIGNEEPTQDNQLPNPEEFNPFFSPQGQGSGFVYDTEGHIVTNNHVVEGASKIYVTFYDGTQLTAEITGVDQDSDLAVIKVEADANALLPVSWGDSEKIKVGQRAITIGNPFGLEGTLTSGIISAVGRSLPSLNPAFRIPEIIQTDAAVNPGNSGGPLLNSDGEVIGVISAIVPRQLGDGERSFLGVGFAIPGNLAKRVVPGLIDGGAYKHPWIGIVGNSLTPEIAAEMNLKDAHGAIVVQTLPGSPAMRAGLRGGDEEFRGNDGLFTQIGGDIIIAIEDEPVTEFDDLISFLSRRASVGDTIELTIIRDGKEMKVDLTLEARPTQEQLFRP